MMKRKLNLRVNPGALSSTGIKFLHKSGKRGGYKVRLSATGLVNITKGAKIRLDNFNTPDRGKGEGYASGIFYNKKKAMQHLFFFIETSCENIECIYDKTLPSGLV